MLFFIYVAKSIEGNVFYYGYSNSCASCDFVRLPKYVVHFLYIFESLSCYFWLLYSIICLWMRLENKFLCNS